MKALRELERKEDAKLDEAVEIRRGRAGAWEHAKEVREAVFASGICHLNRGAPMSIDGRVSPPLGRWIERALHAKEVV